MPKSFAAGKLFAIFVCQWLLRFKYLRFSLSTDYLRIANSKFACGLPRKFWRRRVYKNGNYSRQDAKSEV